MYAQGDISYFKREGRGRDHRCVYLVGEEGGNGGREIANAPERVNQRKESFLIHLGRKVRGKRYEDRERTSSTKREK